MTTSIDDTGSVTITMTGDDEPVKKTPWMLYIIAAVIAFALMLAR